MAKGKLIRLSEHNPTGKIDRENGIIYGVSVITGNREATGHEMWVDETMVEQVVEHGNANKQGLKARFDHPNPCASSMGTAVGRFKNFRKDGVQARADLYLHESSADSPNGDYRTYILNLADEDPEAFATSIVFRQAEPYEPQHEDYSDKDPDDPFFYPHARIRSLNQCDVVDEGAANDGLFGRPDYLAEQAEKFLNHPELDKIVTPLLDKRIEQKLKEMSDTKDTKVSMFDRLKAIFTESDEPKTDEQLTAEFASLTEDLKSLKQEKDDLEVTLSEKEKELGTKDSEIEALETEKTELSGRITELETQLKEAGQELPKAGEKGKEEIQEQELSPAEKKKQAKLAKMREVQEYLEERRNPKSQESK